MTNESVVMSWWTLMCWKIFELNKILDKSEEVVIYWCNQDATVCNPYYETAKAVTWGYQEVFYFIGGAPAWKEAGYPIEADD